MKYCNMCGWKLDYISHSFQDQVKEIRGEKKKSGYWKCPNCSTIIK
jgi:hypothetical protein